MRLRIIDVHGSPEEIGALPQLAEILGTRNRGNRTAEHVSSEEDVATSGGDYRVPEDVAALLSLRPPAAAVRELVDRFLVETLSWADVEARVGASRRSRDGMANALRLHSRGSTVGAFVYLRLPSSTMLLRLPADREGNYKHATPRRVGPDAPYGIAIRLTSQGSLVEALELAHIAYEIARAESLTSSLSSGTETMVHGLKAAPEHAQRVRDSLSLK